MPEVVRYEREGGGLTFERVAFFADAVLAIALTPIVVGIGVPALTDTGDAGDLWRGLGDHFSAKPSTHEANSSWTGSLKSAIASPLLRQLIER